MRIKAFLARADAPMPWSVVPTWSRGEAVHALFDGAGRNLDLRVWDSEVDARRIAALGAIAPLALDYVETAAAKGGAQAQAIVAEFERLATAPLRAHR